MEYKVDTCSITVLSLSFSIFNELCFVHRFTVGMLWRLQFFYRFNSYNPCSFDIYHIDRGVPFQLKFHRRSVIIYFFGKDKLHTSNHFFPTNSI